MMRRSLASAVSCAALVLGFAGCAVGETESTEPSIVSSPSETVDIFTTKYRTMIIDDGDRPPQLCVGGVAQSLPPGCAGIDLEGWDWNAVGDHEQRGSVRWGEFAVSGEYSAVKNTLRVTSASTGGTEPGHTPPPCTEEPGEYGDPSNIERMWTFTEDDLGVRVFSGGDDPVCQTARFRVGYDDGSVQSALDAEFGRGAVIVESALAPAQ